MPRTRSAKKLLKSISLIVLFTGIFGYGLWRAGDKLFGITLAVHTIESGQSVTDPILTLSGKARHAAGVAIDNSPISIDLEGNWTKTLALLPGYNHVTVSAKDKFNKMIYKDFVVYYNAPVALANKVVPEETSAEVSTTDEDISKSAVVEEQTEEESETTITLPSQTANVLDANVTVEESTR